ncbi:PepSY domain-containing protein [Streptomyces actinomycinicus]|uniref:PepSY domain-containing protein n=1 Tax=Streptomyces actinomycinicus TaxID=1695166 RepID=A0A937JLB7_9ACTN|nr:PepSY domain-containing protein [Streptomyces actinomycinicus]MBL1082255.1 PepSY domain-containing protein [Streptomyces actinomycinicus]
MRALPARALLAVPAAVLMFALVACGGGSDSGSSASTSDTQQSAQNAGGAQEGAAEDEAGEEKETPLTGEVKQKAEAAALAKYPGTVVKSEEDREKPGMLAVEVKESDGTSVEVYLDKSYKVTGTKREGTEENEG